MILCQAAKANVVPRILSSALFPNSESSPRVPKGKARQVPVLSTLLSVSKQLPLSYDGVCCNRGFFLFHFRISSLVIFRWVMTGEGELLAADADFAC